MQAQKCSALSLVAHDEIRDRFVPLFGNAFGRRVRVLNKCHNSQDLFELLSDSFDNFARSFCSPHCYVLATFGSTFNNVSSPFNGVQSDNVAGALRRASADVTGALRCSEAYGPRPAAYLTSRSRRMFAFRLGCLTRVSGRLRRRRERQCHTVQNVYSDSLHDSDSYLLRRCIPISRSSYFLDEKTHFQGMGKLTIANL